MNLLKSLTEQDFISQKKNNGETEVLVKKEYDQTDSNNEYICIRKDFLLLLNDNFNSVEEELKKYKEVYDKIRNIIIDEPVCN